MNEVQFSRLAAYVANIMDDPDEATAFRDACIEAMRKHPSNPYLAASESVRARLDAATPPPVIPA